MPASLGSLRRDINSLWVSGSLPPARKDWIMIYKIISSFTVLYILNIIQAFESAKRHFLFQLWNEPRYAISFFSTMFQSTLHCFAGQTTEKTQQTIIKLFWRSLFNFSQRNTYFNISKANFWYQWKADRLTMDSELNGLQRKNYLTYP